MDRLTLDNMAEGQLGDGANIKPGDLLKWEDGPYVGFTRAVMHNSMLCLEEYMHGRNRPIHLFLADASFCHVHKVTLTEIYKFCKKNRWNVAEYMVKFGRKETA